MEKHMRNKESGITLIALVITIIVLLILAGISIQMLTGENGIINRAGEAKDKTGQAEVIEKIKLAYMNSDIDNYTSEESVSNLNKIKEELEKTYGAGNVKVVDNYDGTHSANINGKIYDIDLSTKEVTESESSSYKRVYLYNHGDECTNITGGWSASTDWDTSFAVQPATKLSDRIRFYGTGSIETIMVTNNKIFTNEYNHICYELKSISTYTTYSNLRSMFLKEIGSFAAENRIWTASGNFTQIGDVTYTMDISNAQLPGFLIIHVGGMTEYKYELLSVWLERD